MKPRYLVGPTNKCGKTPLIRYPWNIRADMGIGVVFRDTAGINNILPSRYYPGSSIFLLRENCRPKKQVVRKQEKLYYLPKVTFSFPL